MVLKSGLFRSGGSGIGQIPDTSYCLLLGLASSSEDEYESFIVREKCGRDDEWSDILRSRGEGRRWKVFGAPLSRLLGPLNLFSLV